MPKSDVKSIQYLSYCTGVILKTLDLYKPNLLRAIVETDPQQFTSYKLLHRVARIGLLRLTYFGKNSASQSIWVVIWISDNFVTKR